MIIDSKEIEIQKGETILEAALRSGIFIPHYCFHPALSRPANCRMCLVEIEGQGKLAASCATPAIDKMVVHTDTEPVKQNRKSVLEFLLFNHPLDCPVCDKAGECSLQDYSYRYGFAQSRNDLGKIVQPKKDLGGDILLYTQRCILCTRCVRFTEDYSGTSELLVQNRGSKAEIGVFAGTAIDNPLAGNVVDICPVGALKSKEFLFKARVWNMQHHDTICTRCPVGCNTIVDEQDGVIQRIRPRENLDVNGYFICDIGRHGFAYANSDNRLGLPQVRGDGGLGDRTWEHAIEAARAGLAKAAADGTVGCLASPFLTNEECYLTAELVNDHLGGEPHRRGPVALLPKEDRASDTEFPGGFRISKEIAPNGTGAKDILEAKLGKLRDADSLLADAKAGKLTGLVILGGNPAPERTRVPADAIAKVPFVVVVDILASAVTDSAAVLLPGLCAFEKDGTMTSDRGRVQQIRAILPGPGNARPEWRILSEMIQALGGPIPVSGPEEVLERIARDVPGYAGLTPEVASVGATKEGGLG